MRDACLPRSHESRCARLVSAQRFRPQRRRSSRPDARSSEDEKFTPSVPDRPVQYKSLFPGYGSRVPQLMQKQGFRYNCPGCVTGTCLVLCDECEGAGQFITRGLGTEAYRSVIQRCRKCEGAGLLPCPECGPVRAELRKPDPDGTEYWNRLDAIEEARRRIKARKFRVPVAPPDPDLD